MKLDTIKIQEKYCWNYWWSPEKPETHRAGNARVTNGELQTGPTGHSTSSSKQRIGAMDYTFCREMAIWSIPLVNGIDLHWFNTCIHSGCEIINDERWGQWGLINKIYLETKYFVIRYRKLLLCINGFTVSKYISHNLAPLISLRLSHRLVPAHGISKVLLFLSSGPVSRTL